MDLESILREDILDGNLPAGDKLNISKLKDKYQVSLAPLREALSRLAMTGLLRSEPNKGYYIAPMCEKEKEDVYEISAEIESLAIDQAIERGDSAWEEEIISSLHALGKMEQGEVKPSFVDWMEANQRFHNALIGACSPILKELRRTVSLHAQRYIRQAYKKVVLKDFHGEHKALAQACLARDKRKAKRLIKEHHYRGLHIG